MTVFLVVCYLGAVLFAIHAIFGIAVFVCHKSLDKLGIHEEIPKVFDPMLVFISFLCFIISAITFIFLRGMA